MNETSCNTLYTIHYPRGLKKARGEDKKEDNKNLYWYFLIYACTNSRTMHRKRRMVVTYEKVEGRQRWEREFHGSSINKINIRPDSLMEMRQRVR